MKSAICLTVVALCVSECLGLPRAEREVGKLRAELPGKTQQQQRWPSGEPRLVQRLLRLPIGVVSILLMEPEQQQQGREDADRQGQKNEAAEVEEGRTEENWGELELDQNSPPPEILKSLLVVPMRCKENQGLVGGKCRDKY